MLAIGRQDTLGSLRPRSIPSRRPSPGLSENSSYRTGQSIFCSSMANGRTTASLFGTPLDLGVTWGTLVGNRGADPGGSSGMDAVPWNPDDRCEDSPVGRRKPLAERPGVDAPRPRGVDHHVASPPSMRSFVGARRAGRRVEHMPAVARRRCVPCLSWGEVAARGVVARQPWMARGTGVEAISQKCAAFDAGCGA
jgi:hypothetical protein